MEEDEEENEEYLEGVSDIETLIDILDYKDEEARRESTRAGKENSSPRLW